MRISEVKENKKRYIKLLFLADEQESQIDKYLFNGTMYILEENDKVIAECVVLKVCENTLEIKNIAVDPHFQHKGLLRLLNVA